MQPAALEAARRSMPLARRTDFDVAIGFAAGAIAKTVDSLERQLPDLFDAGLDEASRSSNDRAAGAVADLVVSTTVAFLLPVFEVAVLEHPSDELEYERGLAIIRLYLETVDEVGDNWSHMRAELASRGFPEFGSGGLAGGFRAVLQIVVFDVPFAFIDSKVIRGGEMGGMDAFESSRDTGILRTSEGQFVTWSCGQMAGRYGNLEESLDAVRRMVRSNNPSKR